MNKEIKARWIAALRSGKYHQTDSWLNAHDGMCCLGVLCDLLHPEEWDSGCDVRSIRGENQLPPAEIMREVGLPPGARGDDPVTVVNKLAEMNDDGATFVQIADFIEKTL